MILYSRPDDPAGHAIRLLLTEKGVGFTQEEIDENSNPEKLLHVNPYGRFPTLSSRGVVLYDTRVIVEFIDERYPHPPMMPAEPVARARARLLMEEVNSSWYPLYSRVFNGQGREKSKSRSELIESVLASEALLGAGDFMLSDQFGIVDCMLAPILWRLPHVKGSLPKESKLLRTYMRRLFQRPCFAVSLTVQEKNMVVV